MGGFTFGVIGVSWASPVWLRFWTQRVYARGEWPNHRGERPGKRCRHGALGSTVVEDDRSDPPPKKIGRATLEECGSSRMISSGISYIYMHIHILISYTYSDSYHLPCMTGMHNTSEYCFVVPSMITLWPTHQSYTNWLQIDGANSRRFTGLTLSACSTPANAKLTTLGGNIPKYSGRLKVESFWFGAHETDFCCTVFFCFPPFPTKSPFRCHFRTLHPGAAIAGASLVSPGCHGAFQTLCAGGWPRRWADNP